MLYSTITCNVWHISMLTIRTIGIFSNGLSVGPVCLLLLTASVFHSCDRSPGQPLRSPRSRACSRVPALPVPCNSSALWRSYLLLLLFLLLLLPTSSPRLPLSVHAAGAPLPASVRLSSVQHAALSNRTSSFLLLLRLLLVFFLLSARSSGPRSAFPSWRPRISYIVHAGAVWSPRYTQAVV